MNVIIDHPRQAFLKVKRDLKTDMRLDFDAFQRRRRIEMEELNTSCLCVDATVVSEGRTATFCTERPLMRALYEQVDVEAPGRTSTTASSDKTLDTPAEVPRRDTQGVPCKSAEKKGSATRRRHWAPPATLPPPRWREQTENPQEAAAKFGYYGPPRPRRPGALAHFGETATPTRSFDERESSGVRPPCE